MMKFLKRLIGHSQNTQKNIEDKFFHKDNDKLIRQKKLEEATRFVGDRYGNVITRLSER